MVGGRKKWEKFLFRYPSKKIARKFFPEKIFRNKNYENFSSSVRSLVFGNPEDYYTIFFIENVFELFYHSVFDFFTITELRKQS